MYISLQTILKHPAFHQVKILAGREGTVRIVKRVSVFDCALREDINALGLIDQGDLFVSCLDQFVKEPERVLDFVQTLNTGKCSGLLVVTDENLPLLTKPVLEYCDRYELPLLCIEENMPYAFIMDTIHKFITVENLNAISELKLEKIMYGKLTLQEKMELLYSINPNIKKWIRIIVFEGESQSPIQASQMHIQHLYHQQNIFVSHGEMHLLIFSGASQKELENGAKAALCQLKELSQEGRLGISPMYERDQVDQAMRDAKAALSTAKTMGIPVVEYDALSVMHLLISLGESRERKEFYQRFLRDIQKNTTPENCGELLNTAEQYVLQGGNYKRTAEAMNQHESTVRYRINRIRTLLDMEEDIVRFHETLGLAVKLRMLLGENK